MKLTNEKVSNLLDEIMADDRDGEIGRASEYEDLLVADLCVDLLAARREVKRLTFAGLTAVAQREAAEQRIDRAMRAIENGVARIDRAMRAIENCVEDDGVLAILGGDE
jgi:hypothetical protein